MTSFTIIRKPEMTNGATAIATKVTATALPTVTRSPGL